MAKVFFILGSAGTGKSSLAKRFVRFRNFKRNEKWTIVDIDQIGYYFSPKLMAMMGADPHDRDSPLFKENIRDSLYETALLLIKEQLYLGLNVVVPGPWTKEIQNELIFFAEKMNFPIDTQIKYLYLTESFDTIKKRIEQRNDPRDIWKINNWEAYVANINKPNNQIERFAITTCESSNKEKINNFIRNI